MMNSLGHLNGGVLDKTTTTCDNFILRCGLLHSNPLLSSVSAPQGSLLGEGSVIESQYHNYCAC